MNIINILIYLFDYLENLIKGKNKVKRNGCKDCPHHITARTTIFDYRKDIPDIYDNYNL